MKLNAASRFFGAIILVLILVSSCKKDSVNTDEEEYVPPTVTGPSYSFSRYDGNGLLKIQKTFAYYVDPFKGLVETITKEAKASFKNSPFDSLYSNAAAVSCQGKTLALQNNQTYLLDGSAAANISVTTTLGVNWNVTGNSVTGIPGFLYTTTKPLPEYKGVANNSMPTTIRRAAGLTLSLGANIVGADSIFLSITSGSKTIKKMIGGFENECIFSPAELSVLPSADGAALLQVSPISYELSVQGSKKMYFANQASYTKLVNVE